MCITVLQHVTYHYQVISVYVMQPRIHMFTPAHTPIMHVRATQLEVAS